MTKKQMEERIAQLEQRVMELQSQLLTLSLRGYTFVSTPPVAVPAPVLPRTPIYPYIGDPVPYDGPRITCTTQTNTGLAAQAQARN